MFRLKFQNSFHQQHSPKNRKRLNDQGASLDLWYAGYLKLLKTLTKSFSPYWLACIPLAALIVLAWHSAASAQDAIELIEIEDLGVQQVQGIVNTLFVLIAAVLVIFMNAGFGMLETGFCRQKNAVNILSKNLIVFAIATIAFWAIGFSLMFNPGNSFIGGMGGFFLSSTDPITYGLDPFPAGLPISVFFLFQAAFAGTAATIVSGAVAERVKFGSFVIFSTLLVAISYAITGHWVWSSSGWLAILDTPFSDFAGSTVVHSVGGWSALMGAVILGPRLGKYKDGEIRAIPGHNMSIATLGCLILWIGWFGFNPGSELAADEKIAYIALTTNLAAAAAGISATLTSWLKNGKPDLSMIINGILAGLVAITAGCASVSYTSAVIIGAIAGFIVVCSVSFFDSIKIDDPVGAISVHLVNGVWGTFAVGLFTIDGGFFVDGSVAQLLSQIIGIILIGSFTVVMSSIFWLILKLSIGIRVTPEEEIEGLDISEHGMEAYSGFAKEASSMDSIGNGLG
ncbi:MAG: ammonium transporter [Symploca sp. SIO2E6]|nr:ammonium transporter [Symploca sp. SIO2E6]